MRRTPAPALVLIAAAAASACASAGGGSVRPHGESATFHARNAFTVTPPAGAQTVRCWFAMPQDEEDQQVSPVAVSAPGGAFEVVKDDQGNWFVYVEAKGRDLAPFEVVEEFDVTRWEIRDKPDPAATRALTAEERKQHAGYLGPNANIPVGGEFEKTARQVVGTETNPVLAARRLYDWTLENVDYWVKHPDRLKASPVGSAEYCMKERTGNCTDFHSLWTALARSSGIPTRMVYGSFFKKELDGKDADQSYHCWTEFWVPNLGWIPQDVAVADVFMGDFEIDKDNDEKVRLTTGDGYRGKDLAKVEYYFGDIDDRRVVWNRGRDLRLDGVASGPIDALPKAYVEADGKTLKEKEGWTRKLTFREAR